MGNLKIIIAAESLIAGHAVAACLRDWDATEVAAMATYLQSCRSVECAALAIAVLAACEKS